MKTTSFTWWRIALSASLALAALALATRGPGLRAQELDMEQAIKLDAQRQDFYRYEIPRTPTPTPDVEEVHKKLAKPYEAWLAAPDDPGAREALLAAADKAASKVSPALWLVIGDLRLARAEQAYQDALLSDDASGAALDLGPTLDAYRAAAEGGDATIQAWAHYCTGLATAAEDSSASTEALEQVATSGAVKRLTAEAYVRLGDVTGDADRAAEAYGKALETAEGALRGRATLGLASHAFVNQEHEKALQMALDALGGDLYDGDVDWATRLVVESMAVLVDDRGERLPPDLEPSLAARLLVALGEYWYGGAVGDHPAQAVAAWTAAEERAPDDVKVKRIAEKLGEAREQAARTDETTRQWLERCATLCFARAMVVAPQLNCGADVVIHGGKPGSIAVEATINAATGAGAELLESCLEGPLPEPLSAQLPDDEITVLFNNAF